MYRISKKFSFEASHQLRGLAPGHQCSRLHGHSYEVEVFLEAPTLDKTGFVRDYGELAPLKEWLDKTFDHRHVNDAIEQPTAELMAQHIYERAVKMFPEVVCVRVSETGKTSSMYSPYALPPAETILDIFASLAAEPEGSPQRRALRRALLTLLAETDDV